MVWRLLAEPENRKPPRAHNHNQAPEPAPTLNSRTPRASANAQLHITQAGSGGLTAVPGWRRCRPPKPGRQGHDDRHPRQIRGASRQSPGGAGAGHPSPADRDTTTDTHPPTPHKTRFRGLTAVPGWRRCRPPTPGRQGHDDRHTHPHNTMTSGGAVHPARHRPLRVQGSTSGGAALLGAIPRPDTRQTTWPLQHYDGGGAVHPARNRALACAGVDFRRGSSSRGDPSPRY